MLPRSLHKLLLGAATGTRCVAAQRTLTVEWSRLTVAASARPGVSCSATVVSAAAPWQPSGRYEQRRFDHRVSIPNPHRPPEKHTKKSVEERLLKAIRAWDRFPADKHDALTVDAQFADLGFDSLDLVEISMSIEDEFGFEVPESQIDSFKSPRDVHRWICEREHVFE